MKVDQIARLSLAVMLLLSLVASERLRATSGSNLAEFGSLAIDILCSSLLPAPTIGKILRRIYPARALSSLKSSARVADE